jgi:hypothetical protein
MEGDTTTMDPIERVNSLLETVRQLQDDLEALKQDLVGDTPAKFNPNTMDVLSHMKDIVKDLKGG